MEKTSQQDPAFWRQVPVRSPRPLVTNWRSPSHPRNPNPSMQLRRWRVRVLHSVELSIIKICIDFDVFYFCVSRFGRIGMNWYLLIIPHTQGVCQHHQGRPAEEKVHRLFSLLWWLPNDHCSLSGHCRVWIYNVYIYNIYIYIIYILYNILYIIYINYIYIYMNPRYWVRPPVRSHLRVVWWKCCDLALNTIRSGLCTP